MSDCIKQLSEKSKPKEIRNRILEISKTISKIHCNSNSPEDIKKVYFSKYPQYINDVNYLSSIGISWDSLIDISGWYESNKNNKKEKHSDTEKNIDNSIKIKLKTIKEKIYKVATDILSNNINNSYLSKDVFLVIHPEECNNISSLESIGVSWFQLLLMSGVGDKDFSSYEEKKHCSLHLKKVSEIFGMSIKHFMFMQKLLVYTINEHPEELKNIIENTFQIKKADEKVIKGILSNLTEFIKYLNFID